MNLHEYVSSHEYPGRVLLAGRLNSNEYAFALLLTGRSPASKSRRIVSSNEPDQLLTVIPTDASAGHDDLRHYVASISTERWLVIANGDHAEVVAGNEGSGLPNSLATLAFEPDPPIFTPRITMAFDTETSALWVSSARKAATNDSDVRALWEIDDLNVGCGVAVSTYRTLEGQVGINTELAEYDFECSTQSEFLQAIWTSANPDLKVAAASVTNTGKTLIADWPTVPLDPN